MVRSRMWILGCIVAAVYTTNDLLVVTSDRSRVPWGRLAFIVAANAMCGPAWWLMWREGGAMKTNIVLDVALSVAALVVVLVARERHTPQQWAGFLLVLIGAYVSLKS